MTTTDVRKRFAAKKVHRGSQVIFGERQKLREVLQSVQRDRRRSRARTLREVRLLKALIDARTEELNGVNPHWDRKFQKGQDSNTTGRELLHLAATLPADDYLLARVVTDHRNAPAELLVRLADHPYDAVRENVARHPQTPPEVLRRLAENLDEPLWILVACNPSTPADLRDPLRARMREMAEV
ncbi:MAG: hypothetical protein LAO07_08435 [Acidobacteriia bacterium]|nr:hypothetical protein [Terriglobia bacterium]